MKRIITFLLSLLLALSLCACNIPEVNAPTTSSTETTGTTEPTNAVATTPATENTNPTWHLQETADKLAQYAIDFKWNDGITNLILTVGLPDLDMFDHIEQLNETTYDIYLSDNTIYRMVLDAGSGDVQAIQDIATNTNFYGG